MKIRRPVFRYHGGKWKIAPWILAQMPPHDLYVEPFGGGANVLLRKARTSAECYNDLDGAVVNVFRVLQDPDKAQALHRRLYLTPFAREEFDRCYEPAIDDVDRAAKTIALSFMGFGSDSASRGCRTGFRSKMSDSRALPSEEWARWTVEVRTFVERLRGVTIEQRPALEIIGRLDRPSTLFYCDPPYVFATRTSLKGKQKTSHGYRCEMTDEDHRALADTLHSVRGMVLLSGYASGLYSELYGDWKCLKMDTLADGARVRTECLWLNPAALLRNQQLSLGISEAVAS